MLNFLFVVLDEGGCLRKVDTGDELLACILDAAACMNINLDEQDAIFALELQCA